MTRTAAFTHCCLQAKLEDLEKELVETNNNMERLQRSHAELNEMQLVLENAGKFFDARTSARLASSADDGFGGDGSSPLLEAAVRQSKGCLTAHHRRLQQ